MGSGIWIRSCRFLLSGVLALNLTCLEEGLIKLDMQNVKWRILCPLPKSCLGLRRLIDCLVLSKVFLGQLMLMSLASFARLQL